MAVAGNRVETTVERSSAYDAFTIEDETGKRIGDARSVFLVEGRPRYLQVELRGLFRHRNRIVPWELTTLDVPSRRIRLRCRKGDVEGAPDFDPEDALDSQERQTRTHFGLPADVPEERVTAESPDELADEAETRQAVAPDAGPGDGDNQDRSVAEDLRARTNSLAAAPGSLPQERRDAFEEDEDKEETLASESQAVGPVAIAPDTVDEPHEDLDQRSRARGRADEEEDLFRLGARSFDGWHPTFDVAEVEDGYYVAIDVPGVEADALELRLENDVLIVTGERARRVEGDLQRRESPTGEFRCRFELPPYTNAEAITAELRNGVLELRIPRSAAPEARRIALRGLER
ncbi:MAG: Hsp20 family protein [Actinomycetota bacterium]|nr:Hsp20 family protein [Actinomycetota bacterium]